MRKNCNRANAASAASAMAAGRPALLHRHPPLLRALLWSLALPALCSPVAMAADSARLTVTGIILPTACNIDLGNNGKIDFGMIPAARLSEEGLRRVIDERMVTFSITCAPINQPTVQFKDNRHASVPVIYNRIALATELNKRFGLGRVGDASIGAYLIDLRAHTADGHRARLAFSPNGETDWKFIKKDEVIRKDHVYAWSTTAKPESGSFGTITGELVVKLMPEPIEELPLESKIELDGNATIDLVYR